MEPDADREASDARSIDGASAPESPGAEDANAAAHLASHLDALRAFVHARLGDELRARETTSDLAQSVVREALEHMGGFEYRGEASLRRWLYVRAEHKIQDRGRFWRRARRARSREVEACASAEPGDPALRSFFTPSREAAGREELVRVERAFRALPPDYRRAIVLARIDGLGHEELARALGRTSSGTRTLLSRALARLATLLDEPASR